jgi:hypothetical protein
MVNCKSDFIKSDYSWVSKLMLHSICVALTVTTKRQQANSTGIIYVHTKQTAGEKENACETR